MITKHKVTVKKLEFDFANESIIFEYLFQEKIIDLNIILPNGKKIFLDYLNHNENKTITKKKLGVDNISGTYLFRFNSEGDGFHDFLISDSTKFHFCFIDNISKVSEIDVCDPKLECECFNKLLFMNSLLKAYDELLALGDYDNLLKVTNKMDEICSSCDSCGNNYSNIVPVSKFITQIT